MPETSTTSTKSALPVVIFPLINSGSLFMSDMAAKGRPQLATKMKSIHTFLYQEQFS